MKYWLAKWDGTVNSLMKGSGDLRSILTKKEKKKYVDQFINKSSKKNAVNYEEVKEHVENETNKSISLQTVRRIGREFGHTSKKVKRLLETEGEFFFPILYSFLFRYKKF